MDSIHEKSTNMIRQGDLLFVRVDDAPDGETVKSRVLAEGEATGHAHRLRAGRGRVVQTAAMLYVLNRYRAYVDHEEHETVVLPPGAWEVRRQREYEPEGWRRVAD